MNEELFKSLAMRASKVPGEYGAGYMQGLRRLHYGEKFEDQLTHERRMRAGMEGNSHQELGRGYRDGFAGREPSPPLE